MESMDDGDIPEIPDNDDFTKETAVAIEHGNIATVDLKQGNKYDKNSKLHKLPGKRRFSNRSSLNTHRLDHMEDNLSEDLEAIKVRMDIQNLKHKMDEKHENHTKFHNLNGVDDENNNPVEPDAIIDPTDIEVDDKMKNTLRPKPTRKIKLMTQITYHVHFTFFTFYLLLYHTVWTTCETFNDHEALSCRPVTQLATHCLTRSS